MHTHPSPRCSFREGACIATCADLALAATRLHPSQPDVYLSNPSLRMLALCLAQAAESRMDTALAAATAPACQEVSSMEWPASWLYLTQYQLHKPWGRSAPFCTNMHLRVACLMLHRKKGGRRHTSWQRCWQGLPAMHWAHCTS